MASNNDPIFAVDYAPDVKKDIQRLGQRAAKAGVSKEFKRVLRSVVKALQSNPMEWGDPEYHPKKKGSIVCHGLLEPLFVRYVVYELERVVIILTIEALPDSVLD